MHTVSREELFRQVWERPLMKVAAGYSITGTALKKLCDRHEIPTPERGYWAKLQHGKPVGRSSLPDVSDQLAEVRIVGAPSPSLPNEVTAARERVRESLEDTGLSGATPPNSSRTADESVADVPTLTATLRAIRKARPDGEGFVSAKGRGIVPLRVAPAAIDRCIVLLARFFALAVTQGCQVKATDEGLALLVDDEPVAFSIETPVDRKPHQPTPAELKEQARYAGWGITREPWSKYDHFPSERLSLVIQSNAYSGLRRTFSDRQAKRLEQVLPRILEAFAEHAAFAKQRRREHEESARRYKEAERLRRLDEAFSAREKRRTDFIDAVHTQLRERQKLADVLSHLEASANSTHPSAEMIAWVRRRIRQVDALVSPAFMDMSARSSNVVFSEPPIASDEERYVYYPPISLQYWSIDHAAGEAHSRSASQWAEENGLLSSTGDADT